MVGNHQTNTATAVVYSVLGGLSGPCFLKNAYIIVTQRRAFNEMHLYETDSPRSHCRSTVQTVETEHVLNSAENCTLLPQLSAAVRAVPYSPVQSPCNLHESGHLQILA